MKMVFGWMGMYLCILVKDTKLWNCVYIYRTPWTVVHKAWTVVHLLSLSYTIHDLFRSLSIRIWYLKEFERGYSWEDKGMLATINCLQDWQYAIWSNCFLVLTECVANNFFKKQRYVRPKPFYWLQFLCV